MPLYNIKSAPILFLRFYFNIARGGPNFALTAGCRFGDIYAAGAGIGNKHLIGKQAAAYITRTRFYIQLCGVTPVKFYITRASFNRKLIFGNHTVKSYSSRASA